MPAGCVIHIGTSGWHYKHWLGDFYPQKLPSPEMFSWYAQEFETVDINNSFYRLPEQKTFCRWRDVAPRSSAMQFLTREACVPLWVLFRKNTLIRLRPEWVGD